MSIRIVIADDHHLILDGLEGILRMEDDLEIVARCTSGADALAAVTRTRPDVLVLDLRMPGLDGVDVLRELAARDSETRVILLAASITDVELIECLRLGVSGVVLKDMASAMLVQAVRKVHSGEGWVEKRSIAGALDLMIRREAGNRELLECLTAREIDILRLVAKGLRNREIAQSLTLSEGTVKTHLHNMYSKLGLGGRLELFKYAQERGIV